MFHQAISSLMMKYRHKIGNETAAILLLVTAGVAGRMVWLMFVNKGIMVAGGEAQNVALSVYRNLSVADAFGRGSGLTAHVNPLLPIFAGLLYRIFGWGAIPAELILILVSFFFVFGAALILYDCFRRLGIKTHARLVGFALFCILPINLRHEVVMFRIWEGGLATFILALALRQLLILDGKLNITMRERCAFAFTAAFGLFVNPAAGLAIYVAGAVFMLRNMDIQKAVATTLLAVLVLLVVLAPWTVRNEMAFGRFVPLRSNYGLEIALANHPGVQSNQSDSVIFTKRWKEIHPFATQSAFDRMQGAGGEQVYTKELGRQAWAWMSEHPELTAKLAGKHILQFYFPPEWQDELWGGVNRGTKLKAYTIAILTALALFLSTMRALSVGGIWVYAFLFLIVPSVPYAIVQPTARYHYLISTISLYFATSIISSISFDKSINFDKRLVQRGPSTRGVTRRRANTKSD